MLKNIEKSKEKGIEIQPQYLKPDLYSFQIPPHILKGLGLLAPGEKALKRVASRLTKRSGSHISGDRTNASRTKNNSSAMNTATMGAGAFDAYNGEQINLQTQDASPNH